MTLMGQILGIILDIGIFEYDGTIIAIERLVMTELDVLQVKSVYTSGMALGIS